MRRLPRRTGSVQQHFVKAEAVHDELLCLRSETAGQQEYVAVLHVDGISYDLKDASEQQQLNDLNQQFLASLDFDLQVLWVSEPFQMDAYLEPFRRRASLASERPEATGEDGGVCDEQDVPAGAMLSAAHIAQVEQLQAGSTLLSRSIYLVYRAQIDPAAPTRSVRLLGIPFARQPASTSAQTVEHARQLLALRTEQLLRTLSGMQLSGRRLAGPDLIRFSQAALAPASARRFPLPTEVLQGLGRPVQLREEAALARADRGQRREFVPSDPSASAASGAGALDLGNLTDLLAPDAIVVAPDHLQINDEFARVLVVTRLPRQVGAGWLRPLTTLAEPLVVSYHLHPLQTRTVLPRLQRLATEHAASQQAAQAKGNQADPQVRVAASDLETLLGQLASGEERMLQVSIQILIRGQSLRELDERTRRVRDLLHSLLLVVRLPRFQHDLALLSCLPHAHNRLEPGVLLSSRAASSLFLFVSHSQFHATGVLQGITPQGDPVVIDPWELPNANGLVLGPPGWGKSYGIKTLIERFLLKHAGQILVIDPAREYGRLCRAFAGQVVQLAPGSPHHLNPFDLPQVGQHLTDGLLAAVEQGDRLADHVQRLHTLLDLMLADRSPAGASQLTSSEKGLLDRALYEVYRRVGITRDPRTHHRQAPLLRDLYEVLRSEVCGKDLTGLAQRLHRYVHGSLSGLFSEPTNVALDRRLIIFDLHDLESELRPVGLFLVSNFVSTIAFQSRIPRLLIVDEAAHLMQFASGAAFLGDLVRQARKYYLGVWLLSQHPESFRGSDIPANCETQVLLHQDVTVLDLLAQMFKLSAREQHLVQRLPVGEALLLTSTRRLHVRFLANPLEHLLSTTNPRELAAWQSDPGAQQVRETLSRLLSLPELSRVVPDASEPAARPDARSSTLPQEESQQETRR